jgi:PAS domain S-box-containing protein
MDSLTTARHTETLDVVDALLENSARHSLESLCRDVVEQAPVGIAFFNRDGTCRNCNAAFCALLGFSVEEIADQSISSLTHREDLPALLGGLERLWRGEIALLDLEKRCLCKDGGELWVRVTTSLVRGRQAGPACAVSFVRDISARKSIAAELIQNQTLLAAVIAELPLALLACDTSGHVTFYNPRAVELFGLPGVQTHEANAGDLYPITSAVFLPDGKTPVPREQRPLARALAGEEISNVELVSIRPDGAARSVRASGRRLVAPDGTLLGAVVVIEDITERRQAEQTLERMHEQLLVASRHAGMAEVATSILHNVGNILNSVNVTASLLAERVKNSKCAGVSRVAALLAAQAADLPAFFAGARGQQVPIYLKELAADLLAERDAAAGELTALRANVEHIKEIVAMQQSYAKRGGLTELLEIRTLVDDSLSMNDAAFSRHGITLIRDYQDVPQVSVDKHKVLQILVNLIRNAGHACDEAGSGSEKRVTVRVRRTQEAVQIAVIDTGVGILQENLARIFNHGFTTRKDGHGFGLHSSALAARELGGSLQAESPGPRMGATFTLTLPLTASEPQHE